MKFQKLSYTCLGLALTLGLVSCTIGGNSSSTSTNTTSSSQTSISSSSSVEPVPIDTRYTDELKIDLVAGSSVGGTYVGRGFFSGGVSEAELGSCIDGDTASFIVEGRRETVRFLGINTPESTAVIQPWGKEASKFTCEILTEADDEGVKIYLESEDYGIDSTGNRYLSWVWVGERLLNLEIVENAYSTFNVTTQTHYFDTFLLARDKAIASQKRYAGHESDPSFNYSTDVINLSIKELVENFETYLDGSSIQVSGIITRIISGHLYIQQSEYDEVNNITKQYSIYLYTGPGGADLSYLKLGDEISVIGQANTFNEARQLSIASRMSKLKILSNGNEAVITPVPSGSISFADYCYMFIEFTNAKVTNKLQASENGDYTAFIKLDNGTGQELQLRVSAMPGTDPYANTLKVGNVVNIRGILSQYYDDYQLLITSNASLGDVVVVS